MDLMPVDGSISDRVRNLASLDPLHLADHIFHIFLRGQIRKEINQCRDSLGNRLGRNHINLFILGQALCLFRGQDNILIVRKNVDHIRVDLFDGVQKILGAGIHGLPALDQIIGSDPLENIRKAVAYRNGDKAVGLALFRIRACGHCLGRFFGLCSLRICPFRLSFFCLRFLFRRFSFFPGARSILDQAFMMLFPHIIDLKPGKRSIGQRLLDCLAGMVCMNMDLYDVIVRNDDDRITDGL